MVRQGSLSRFLPGSHPFLATISPPRMKFRFTFSVFALLCISTYLFAQFAQPRFHQRTTRDKSHDFQTVTSRQKVFASGEKVQLDASQELAAISSFLASQPQNMIPLSVNPSRSIDPELILDFDTRRSRAGEEVARMVTDVWQSNPVFLYSKLYSPASREVKAILGRMNILPSPTIIDVDIRDDANVLEPIIRRLTSVAELPVLLVGGKSIGTIEEMRRLDNDGTLRKLVSATGALVDGSKKKHRH